MKKIFNSFLAFSWAVLKNKQNKRHVLKSPAIREGDPAETKTSIITLAERNQGLPHLAITSATEFAENLFLRTLGYIRRCFSSKILISDNEINLAT